jgi:flagellar biosynthesis anti-sigma factor FlgM
MRIDPKHLAGVKGEGQNIAGPSQSGRVSGPEGSAGGSPRPAAPKPADGLTLSPKAEEFRRARTRLESIPDPSKPDRVAALKARVAAGTYAVDGRKVAEAMLQDEPTAGLLGLPTKR